MRWIRFMRRRGVGRVSDRSDRRAVLIILTCSPDPLQNHREWQVSWPCGEPLDGVHQTAEQPMSTVRSASGVDIQGELRADFDSIGYPRFSRCRCSHVERRRFH